MATLNKVFIIGNLTKDPEVRHTPSGAAVADLRVAINNKFKTSTGEMREETCFVNVTAWNRQAETCGEYLSKGSPLMVEGRLKFDEWEKEGQKQSRLSVVAERVQFLSDGKKTERKPAADRRADAPPADDDDMPF